MSRFQRCFQLLCLPLWCLACSTALAHPPHYALRQWASGRRSVYGMSIQRSVVQVYDVKTKRPIWTRSYSGLNWFIWSQDHRALALTVAPEGREMGNPDGYHLVIWRAGERIWTITHQPVNREDYVEDMVWSPRDSYLLVRIGGSGMADEDIGAVWCVDLLAHKTYAVGEANGRPSWVGTRTVKFWTYHFSQSVGVVRSPKPSLWRVPHRLSSQ